MTKATTKSIVTVSVAGLLTGIGLLTSVFQRQTGPTSLVSNLNVITNTRPVISRIVHTNYSSVDGYYEYDNQDKIVHSASPPLPAVALFIDNIVLSNTVFQVQYKSGNIAHTSCFYYEQWFTNEWGRAIWTYGGSYGRDWVNITPRITSSTPTIIVTGVSSEQTLGFFRVKVISSP